MLDLAQMRETKVSLWCRVGNDQQITPLSITGRWDRLISSTIDLGSMQSIFFPKYESCEGAVLTPGRGFHRDVMMKRQDV